ncbi:MAG: DUF1080 domain-containing protein [Verrucomicrobiota bacterium]
MRVPSGRVELFNGKDLSGWTFASRSNAPVSSTWMVTNGVIHCTGQPFGYARSTSAWRDYKLTVEWRFVKVAPKADNSGVLLHLQPPDQVWPKCIQCQGQYQHQGDVIPMGGATCDDHGLPMGTKIEKRGASNENAPGEWNLYEMVCDGAVIDVGVNGKEMNHVAGCSLDSGCIGFQSEGGELEIRRVTLEALGKAEGRM